MTVAELKRYLDNCDDQDAQVVIDVPRDGYIVEYGIKSVRQHCVNAAMGPGDPPWMVNVVEITVRN